MALMSQTISFTGFDDGLLIEGLRSVLITLELLLDGAVQWHLEYKRQAKLPKKRSISEILSIGQISKWYRAN